VLLWVGRPVAFKNVDLLLVAYKLVRAVHPSARLLMVGDFSSRPDFARRAQAEAVIFAGRVDHDRLPAYYQMADVYVHSSRYEGFGKVLVESLAAGTPVVATHGDGPCEIVRSGETGLLTAHTPEALSAAILELLSEPARAQVMGEAGQRDVLERFDYERQLDAIVESFRTTLKVARERTPSCAG
jgi:phosphatidylinositol alpha-1,6-mannosyltransferase